MTAEYSIENLYRKKNNKETFGYDFTWFVSLYHVIHVFITVLKTKESMRLKDQSS